MDPQVLEEQINFGRECARSGDYSSAVVYFDNAIAQITRSVTHPDLLHAEYNPADMYFCANSMIHTGHSNDHEALHDENLVGVSRFTLHTPLYTLGTLLDLVVCRNTISPGLGLHEVLPTPNSSIYNHPILYNN